MCLWDSGQNGGIQDIQTLTVGMIEFVAPLSLWLEVLDHPVQRNSILLAPSYS